jgi:hypothetical protein
VEPISLRYQVGPAESLARDRLLHGDMWKKALDAVWRDVLLFGAACLLGLFAAFLAQSNLLMLLFATALLARMTVLIDLKKNFQANLAALAERSIRRRDVSLMIDAEGLHEQVEGVTSFAPWSSVKSYAIADDVLFIELGGALWSIIPFVAFLGAGAPSQAEFLQLLQTQGIAARQPSRHDLKQRA